MGKIKIIIPGIPIAKKRPRFARRGRFTVAYNDQQTEEGKFLLLAREMLNGFYATGPIAMGFCFVFPRPKSHYGAGKNSDKLKPSAPVYHVTRPDMDNLIKFVKDCLNGEAWKDDSQVCLYDNAVKCYGDNPRTVITIRELG